MYDVPVWSYRLPSAVDVWCRRMTTTSKQDATRVLLRACAGDEGSVLCAPPDKLSHRGAVACLNHVSTCACARSITVITLQEKMTLDKVDFHQLTFLQHMEQKDKG